MCGVIQNGMQWGGAGFKIAIEGKPTPPLAWQEGSTYTATAPMCLRLLADVMVQVSVSNTALELNPSNLELHIPIQHNM